MAEEQKRSGTPGGGKPFEPGVIERVAGALRYAVTGEAPAWFGPNLPMAPQAPEEVKGRPFDFPVGVNLNYNPKREASESGITFDVLRRISDPAEGGLDVLRTAIETRKDQMEGQRWVIRGKDGEDGGDRAKALSVALRRPDLVHTYRQWMRQLVEDLLVIDAPTIYLRPMAEGFKLPEVVDGATIKILADRNGRRPMPPEPAFQQVIKGLPANNYTLEELLYSPRNLRSHRFYGMSPVEQVVNIINLGLKRQLHLISYYTAGNIPEQLVATPEDWNPDQIQMAQQWMDSILAGNVEARRKLILVPGGMEPKELKAAALTDSLDEWIARVVCWAFSLSPGALVKDQNRATAQVNAGNARVEGLEPLKEWWADLMNEVIVRCWGADDLEFAWADEEITDPQVKAAVLTSYVQAKILTPDEAREDLGKKPLTPEQKEELNPPPPPGLGADGLGAPGEGGGKPGAKPGTPQGDGRDSASGRPPASKLEKKKSLPALNRERPITRKTIKRINTAATAYLSAIRDGLLADLRAEKLAKADLTPERVREILASLSDEERPAFLRILEEELARVAQDGAGNAVAQVLQFQSDTTDEALDAMLSQANEAAVAWAQERAGALVGMKKDPDTGEWVENPNPAWSIDETTREEVNTLVGQATEEGWSNDELADALEESGAFSSARAEMIARTETAMADVQGNLAGWKESGVVEGKEWSVSQDEVCDECNALDGVVVPLDGSFPNGDPPLHPNCRCDVLPVMAPRDEAGD